MSYEIKEVWTCDRCSKHEERPYLNNTVGFEPDGWTSYPKGLACADCTAAMEIAWKEKKSE